MHLRKAGQLRRDLCAPVGGIRAFIAEHLPTCLNGQAQRHAAYRVGDLLREIGPTPGRHQRHEFVWQGGGEQGVGVGRTFQPLHVDCLESFTPRGVPRLGYLFEQPLVDGGDTAQRRE